MSELPAPDAVPAAGPAAAAILAAGVFSVALGTLSLAGDASPAINHALSFYTPTGALSGVSTVASGAWLAVWGALAWRWRGRQVDVARIGIIASLLLAAGLLLTFPPAMDLLLGK